MFGYEFVDLSPGQIELRRRELDQTGYLAYLAPVLLLVSVYLSRKLSENVSATLSNTKSAPNTLVKKVRQITWRLNDTYIGEFGPLKVQVLGALYAAVLLWLTIRNTGNDYMHVTKAFGHVAVSQLPVHYLLSVKTPYSPITLATGLTHERLNDYHRLFGRILHAMLATHAILYLNFFVAIGVIAKRIKDSDVRLGVAAFWTLNFLGVLAVPPIRKNIYHKVFYRSHVVLSALLLAVLWFHVKYSRVYVAQAAIFWVLSGVFRRASSHPAKVICVPSPNKHVAVNALTEISNRDLRSFLPGSHIYLNQSGLGPKTPFTVLSVDSQGSDKANIRLVAKLSDGPQTRLFANAAQSKRELDMYVEGAYGEVKSYYFTLAQSTRKSSNTKILIVAGGVGATYALPLYRNMLLFGIDQARIKMVWSVKDLDDTMWSHAFLEELHSRITSTPVLEGVHGRSMIDVYCTQAHVEEHESRERHVRTFSSGRPNLEKIVDDFVKVDLADPLWPKSRNTQNDETLIVLSCGPAGLIKSLRAAVGRHVFAYGKCVIWHEEQFGFGG